MKYILLLVLVLIFNCYATVKPLPIEGCQKISGTPGPEDLAIDRETGILYISSHERRGDLVDGKLFQLDLNKADAKPKLIETNYPKEFRPHGISLATIGGKKLLYVISHRGSKMESHSIEIFQLEKDKLKHIETIESQTLVSPNDLFVVNDGRIFVSNDRGSGSMFRAYVDVLFGINRALISYFDGKNWIQFEKAVSFGNGILHRKVGDKEFVYRAATTPEEIYKYELINQNNKPELKEIKVIKIGSGPDNLEEDEKGDIYLAAHKSIFRFLKHKDNPDYPSPSQIFVLDKNDNIKEIYANDGTEIPASSTGLRYKNRLLISQVFNPYILSCPIN